MTCETVVGQYVLRRARARARGTRQPGAGKARSARVLPQLRRKMNSRASVGPCGGRPQGLQPAWPGRLTCASPPRAQAAAVAAAFGRAEVTALAWLHLVLLDLAQARRAPTLTLSVHPHVT